MRGTKADPIKEEARAIWESDRLSCVAHVTCSMNNFTEVAERLEAMTAVGWVHHTTAITITGTSAIVLMTFGRPHANQ